MTSLQKSVALVVTSHRAVRVGPSIGTFVGTLLQPAARVANITLKTVDVKSFNLPVFNEALPPKMMASKGIEFEQEASKAKAWAKEMSSHDAYIFLVNEYNYGMSGATKNAIDYLWTGFVQKPVMIVSYGGTGGQNASEQVSIVLSGMGLQVVEPKVHLAFAGGLGPDMFSAVFEGKLGESSQKEWTSKLSNETLDAFKALENELKKEDHDARTG